MTLPAEVKALPAYATARKPRPAGSRQVCAQPLTCDNQSDGHHHKTVETIAASPHARLNIDATYALAPLFGPAGPSSSVPFSVPDDRHVTQRGQRF